MTTSNFLTTYRSDFLWPFIRSTPLRPGCEGVRFSTVPSPEQALERGLSLDEYERILAARRRCQREAEERAQECGQAGPHTPAALALGAPVGLCTPAELQVARNDRAAHNLKQLQEKHPYLFNVIRSCPPDDLVTRVFKDRYRSVYQVDYCKQGEYPNSEYDALVAGAGLAGCAPGALPHCPCRSAKFSSARGGRMAVVSLDRNQQLQACEAAASRKVPDADLEVCLCGLTTRGPAYGRKCSITCTPRSSHLATRESGTGLADGLNQYHTEYRDVYNKLGNYIISERIHCGDRGRRTLLGH